MKSGLILISFYLTIKTKIIIVTLEIINVWRIYMADLKNMIEDENKIDTIISNDINFKGKLKFKHSLKIKGTFEGKIETDGYLIIGREATVSADIKARVVSVSGIVNGKIKASQRINLHKNSKTNGDLIAPDLMMEQGSLFNGTCLMSEKN